MKDPKKKFESFDDCADFVLGKAHEVLSVDSKYLKAYDARGCLESLSYLRGCWDDYQNQFRRHWYERLIHDVSGRIAHAVYHVEFFDRNRRVRKNSGENTAREVEEKFLSHFPGNTVNTRWYC